MYPPPDPTRSPSLTTWPRASAANDSRFEANTAPTNIVVYPRIFLTTPLMRKFRKATGTSGTLRPERHLRRSMAAGDQRHSLKRCPPQPHSEEGAFAVATFPLGFITDFRFRFSFLLRLAVPS